VLITSRNPAWRDVADVVRVREFTRDESIVLLRQLAPELTDVEADRVAASVGDLPLAVEQAGSLLSDTGLTADKYLRLLAERAEDVLDHDQGGSYPRSVTASWAVAFDRLANDDPVALNLLTLIAWFGPEPVPLDLLTEHPDALPGHYRPLATDPLLLARCTAILHRRGMATVLPHSIQLHRVPAALLRARFRDPSCSTTVVRLLRTSVSEDPWNNPSTWGDWQEMLPHVLAATDPDRPLEEVHDEVAWLLGRAGAYHHTRGEVQAALPLLTRAYNSRRARLGDEHPDTLASANNLAFGLFTAGEYQQSRTLNEDTLARHRRIHGDDHPRTLT